MNLNNFIRRETSQFQNMHESSNLVIYFGNNIAVKSKILENK